MFYTIFWLILYLVADAPSINFTSPIFWSLIVALLADLFIRGWPYIVRRV